MNESDSERYFRIYENEKLNAFEVTSSTESFYNYLLESALYIFSWDDISNKDASQMNGKMLVDYIHENYKVDWILKANIEKSENNTAIKIASENHYLLLELDEKNKKVILTIDDNWTDEFDTKKMEEKLNIYEKPPKAAVYLNPLQNSLIWHYVKADLLALRYQSKYMKAGNLIYYMAAAAVLTVTFQMIFFAEYPQLLILEFIEIVIVLIVLIFLHYGEYQRKWIDYRFLAEQLRVGLFMCLAGRNCKFPDPPPYLAVPVRKDDWTVKIFSFIWNKRPDIVHPPLQFLKKFLKVAWIDYQLNYFSNKSYQHGANHLKFIRYGKGLFALTVAVATIDALIGLKISVPLDFSQYHSLLAFMAITFPTLSAAIAGIRIHRDYQRNAQRYSQMSLYLNSVSKQIYRAQDMKALNDILDDIHYVIVLENYAWRAELEREKMEA